MLGYLPPILSAPDLCNSLSPNYTICICYGKVLIFQHVVFTPTLLTYCLYKHLLYCNQYKPHLFQLVFSQSELKPNLHPSGIDSLGKYVYINPALYPEIITKA